MEKLLLLILSAGFNTVRKKVITKYMYAKQISRIGQMIDKTPRIPLFWDYVCFRGLQVIGKQMGSQDGSWKSVATYMYEISISNQSCEIRIPHIQT